ncbi:MAG: Actin-like ATPase involved in cell division-like protein [Candidatus Berkelbacteria bacterium Athens1014_28]|uniref:Actin-like ATPase involved in cell division-like protein n=1 Tax=Candidatus Berkelbacteria bacterium Athens1014_28 TaxID=2017145 RepID=A0A554LP06_9BACT|nr:MAG: Actin-like ATPase involved in cell division-like protein [Candidatus Berkelbacteria bacterium Athens1014_28]
MALDIGTEFVKSLIFHVDDDQARVLGVGRQRQKLSDMQGGRVTDISGVISNCEKALDQAAEEAGVAPTQCVVGIAGELVKGATTTVHYQRPAPKSKISVSELKAIITEVQKKAFEKARSNLAWETGYSEIDVRLVNCAVVDVKIDGYKVTNPVGFQGREVSVGIFNAFAPVVHLGALQTITEGLGLDLLGVVAEPYAVARSMGMDESVEFSAIFIDVGGGTTDIAVVRNGGVEGTKMFAIGGRVFTKRLANEFDLSFSEAEKLKISYSFGELKKEMSDKVKNALEIDCQTWVSGVQLGLEEFLGSDLLPSKILLCGGGSMLPDIKKILEISSWSDDLPFAKKPKVSFIRPSDITSVLDQTESLSDPQDITPMALANMAIDLAGQPSVISGTVDKVMDSLKE